MINLKGQKSPETRFKSHKNLDDKKSRMILPQNLYTDYYGTCNLSNLLKFIDLRTHEGAQWEIQKVAEACLEIASDLWPVAVESYRDVKYGRVQESTT